MNQGNIRKHSYNTNFTVIPNSIAQDENLTWEERGMLLFLQSLPQDWKIYKSSLHNFSKNGDTNTRRVFDNLVEKGYIVTTRIKSEDGKFVGYEHIFDMTKQFGDESKNTVVGKPHIGLPNIGQSPTTKEIVHTKEKEKKEKDINDDLLKLEFDKFRRMYKGEGKRGIDKEWDYFKKKHKNYTEIVPKLVELYEKHLEYRKQKEQRREFVPPHKNFSTYVNNACWEEMYEIEMGIADKTSVATNVVGVYLHTPSGKYWKEYIDGKKYVCQRNGNWEYNNDGTKIPFDL